MTGAEALAAIGQAVDEAREHGRATPQGENPDTAAALAVDFLFDTDERFTASDREMVLRVARAYAALCEVLS